MVKIAYVGNDSRLVIAALEALKDNIGIELMEVCEDDYSSSNENTDVVTICPSGYEDFYPYEDEPCDEVKSSKHKHPHWHKGRW